MSLFYYMPPVNQVLLVKCCDKLFQNFPMVESLEEYVYYTTGAGVRKPSISHSEVQESFWGEGKFKFSNQWIQLERLMSFEPFKASHLVLIVQWKGKVNVW
jgi:hypothetical protein